MNACWLLTAALCATNPAEAQVAAPTETVVLKLAPAAEPVPSLRYRLLPELREQIPGNAMTSYYRAFSPEWQGHRRDKKTNELLEKAAEMPLNELRNSETGKQLDWLRTSTMLREVDRAARRTYCDWELLDRIREDGVGLLLPELQELRTFARLLTVRARLEMADGKFDDAARTLATGYAMARHAGDGPTLLHGLVGIALASVMNKQVETWVQTPGSPNLYWSLTDLPQPMIDLRKCLQGERIWIDNFLPDLREHLKDPAKPPMTAEAMLELSRKMARFPGGAGADTGLFSLFMGSTKYSSAKKFLAAHGWTAAQIEAMPALQAVFLHELSEYDRFFDVMTRAASLPYVQAQRSMKQGEEEFSKAVTGPPMGVPMLSKLLMPAISKVAASRVSLDRRIAALRTVEAVRLFAAANGGKLPEKLDAITSVPLPLDPVTGLPFNYNVIGDKAKISAPQLPGLSPSHAIDYEITIAK